MIIRQIVEDMVYITITAELDMNDLSAKWVPRCIQTDSNRNLQSAINVI